MLKRNLVPLISGFAIAALSTATVATAQDGPGDQSEIPPGPETDAPTGFTPSVEFSGFVDGAVTTTFYAGSDAPDNEQVVFGLDQAEVDMTAEVTERLTVQMDLNFVPGISAEEILEQGYFTYFRSTDGEGLFMTFGRFNAPIGAEAVDAPDMYQYSHGPLYNNAAATNLTGLALGVVSGDLTAQLFLTNDWDEFYSPGDLSIAGRVDYSFGDGNIGAILMASDVVNADTDGEITFDANFDYAVDMVTIIAELHFAYLLADLNDETNVSYGAMLKANFAISDPFGLTARVSYLNRYEDLIGMDIPRGVATNQLEATLAGLFTLSENLYAILEVRMDKFLGDGAPDYVTITPAFELTAVF